MTQNVEAHTRRIQLAISGCAGRMGRAIGTLAWQDPAFQIRAALEASGPKIGKDYGSFLDSSTPMGVLITDDVRAALSQSDVLIEFTLPEATVTHVRVAQQLGRRVGIVIGTTGLSDAEQQIIRAAAKTIPIVFSPNMSMGVTVLFELAKIAAQRLGITYDVEIVETHHRHKQDAPSGTAKRLAQVIAETRQQDTASIPVHAVRVGDIVGDHTVILAGPGERLELTHRAHSREVFARGALRAARFIVTQPPGLYDMTHVLKTGNTGAG